MRSFLSFLLSYLIAFQPLFAAQKFGSDIDLQGNKLQNAQLDKLAVPDFLEFATSDEPTAPATEGSLKLFTNDGKLMSINKDGTVVEYGNGEGNIVGPETSTNNGIATFDDETGKVLASNTATLSGGDIAGLTKATVDNIEIDGNTIYTTDTNGDLVLEPNGTGSIFANSIFGLRSGKALRLFDDDNSNYINVNAPSSITANRSYTIPDDANFSTFVGTGAAQTLTNKDIDGGTASNSNRLTPPKNTKTNLDSLTRKEGTIVYATDQAKLFVDNGSTLTPVGSGSGSSGEVNAVTNPNAATDLTGYADSDAGSDVSRDTTAANLALYPTIETGVKVNADAATEYISYCGAMPAGLKNRKLKLEWFQVPESGYATGDQKLEVYSTTSSTCASSLTRLALSTDASSVTAIPNATGKFTTTADTNSDSYFQIRWVRVSGTKFLTLQNIIYGPGIQPQGAVVTGYASFTPTITGVTTSASGARWLRVGEKMHLEGTFTLSASGSAQWKLALPSGYTFGSVVGSIGNNTSMGYGYGTFYVSGASSRALGLYLNTDNTISFYDNASGVLLSSGDGASGQIVSFTAQIPIAEWAGSGTLNVAQANDVEYVSNSSTSDADDAASFVYGPQGSPLPGSLTGKRYKQVRFQIPIQPTDLVILEYSSDSGQTWLSTQANNMGTLTYANQNGTEYGMYLAKQTSTDYRVFFSRYMTQAASTYGAAGNNWDNSSGTRRWRVRKVANGNAVGFGAATATSRGLVSAEESGSFTVNFTGARTTSSVIKYYRVGKQVTLFIPNNYSVNATANDSFVALASIPASIRPPSNNYYTLLSQDNALTGIGQLTLESSGNLKIYSSPIGAGLFTNGALCGWYATHITYLIN